MQLYLARVEKKEDADRYAGVQEEAEDIRVHILSLENALKLIEIWHFQDAKTIICAVDVVREITGEGRLKSDY